MSGRPVPESAVASRIMAVLRKVPGLVVRKRHGTVIRLFYVGITRARDTLYICQPESHRAVAI